MNIHPQARTTAQLRQEIKESPLSNAELARKYNVHRHTIAKWRRRESFEDKSHRPNNLQTTLSPAQELIVVELRKTLLLPLDDLLVVTREFICPEASRSALQRLMVRYNVSSVHRLKLELEQQTGEEAPKKTYKDYAPGFVHIDVKYLPQMPDEKKRRYLFVAIDRASRWVYFEILPDKTAKSAVNFLKRVAQNAPFKIAKLLTDNGKEFTDRLFRKNKVYKPSGNHQFDKACLTLGIEHRLTKPRSPQTNGMVERFNGRIAELLKGRRFDSRAHLEELLQDYQRAYNHQIPQRALDHQTPIQTLKLWAESAPELFTKKVYDLSGLDT